MLTKEERVEAQADYDRLKGLVKAKKTVIDLLVKEVMELETEIANQRRLLDASEWEWFNRYRDRIDWSNPDSTDPDPFTAR